MVGTPSGFPVKGIDVSHYNGDISHVVKSCDYVISQATVGTWTDPAHSGDAKTVCAAGVVLGAYHYGVYGPGPTRQAQKFLAVVGGGPAFLAVDAEFRGSHRLLAHPATIQAIIVNIRKFDPFHRKILLYSSRATDVIVKGRAVSIWAAITAQNDNWVADYVGRPDRPTAPGAKPHWRFWQYTSESIDKDVFNGSLAQFRAWL